MNNPVSPRYWLVFANANRCNHYKALKESGFINWKKNRVNFSIGDVVYLFSSKERKIIYKTVVTGTEIRKDGQYWVEKAPIEETYRLEALEEYTGDALSETMLMEHGFKGGRSLETPSYRNKELMDYIKSQF